MQTDLPKLPRHRAVLLRLTLPNCHAPAAPTSNTDSTFLVDTKFGVYYGASLRKEAT